MNRSTSESPRERLLNTATALLDKEGIQSVGINRLIAEAGVALMTLYRQFGDKDTLVAASLEHWSTDWLQWLTEQLDRRGDDRRLASTACSTRWATGSPATASTDRSSPAPRPSCAASRTTRPTG